jgi:GTPase SAR1 family protein
VSLIFADIKELIAVEDAMEELQYGPNGGLMFCLEYLLDNIEWLTSDLGEYQDEFLIVDCPGQIELYTHSDIMSRIVSVFQMADYKPCGIYLMESLFLQDITKFFAGVLTATSAMLQIGIPHLNVISKMDLLESRRSGEDPDVDDAYVTDDLHHLHRYFYPDPSLLNEQMSESTRPKFLELNRAIVQLIDEFDMVNFIPLNIKKESSLQNIMMHIEMATQFSEALEPKEPKDDQGDGQSDDRE